MVFPESVEESLVGLPAGEYGEDGGRLTGDADGTYLGDELLGKYDDALIIF